MYAMLQKILVCFLLLNLGGTGLNAQCAILVNCPAGPDTICDPAFNNAKFWHETYWFDPLHNSHDLAEGNVDLPLYVLDSCGTGNVTISYVLLLDLNNDGLRETAVTSDNLPAANIVNYGNAVNPGYTGGTPRNFDERLVTAAQKYRFGLSQNISDDTLVARVRWINATDTINARLPAGTHRIEWRLQQGTVVKTGQYNFTVRDCFPPLLLCRTGFSVYLDPAGTVEVALPALLISAADNYTPTAQLLLSLQEAEASPGFPVDSTGNTVPNLNFNCSALGFHLLEVWAKDKAGLTDHCQTFVIVEDSGFVCSPPPPIISEVCIKNFCDGQGVEGATFNLQGGNPADTPQPIFSNGITPATGCILMAIPSPPANTLFFANKDDNPLNGVSTYDLVLISRHILGLQPLGSPYKMIAADVNQSNSITTFDMVELRKLILGIYQKLPNNTSWRFVDAAFVFPNADNPFQTAFPEGVSLPNIVASTAAADFFGIKIGDVNCSALTYAPPPEDRSATVLLLPDAELTAGTIIDIALRPAEAGAWLGTQGSLLFDAEKLGVEDITSSKLPGWSANNRAFLPGQVNWSWSSPTRILLFPGDTLLTVRLKALAPVRLRDVLSFSATSAEPVSALRSEAYAIDGSRLPLALQFSASDYLSDAGSWVFSPQPNPTAAGVTIPLRLAQAEQGLLEIMDLTGRTVFSSTRSLDAGAQLLEVPAAAFPQPGLYAWRMRAGHTIRTGKLVKI